MNKCLEVLKNISSAAAKRALAYKKKFFRGGAWEESGFK